MVSAEHLIRLAEVDKKRMGEGKGTAELHVESHHQRMKKSTKARQTPKYQGGKKKECRSTGETSAFMNTTKSSQQREESLKKFIQNFSKQASLAYPLRKKISLGRGGRGGKTTTVKNPWVIKSGTKNKRCLEMINSLCKVVNKTGRTKKKTGPKIMSWHTERKKGKALLRKSQESPTRIK